MKDIKLVENVQRGATKFIVNDFPWTTSHISNSN